VGANQLWSVGIEEQFYLFWPVLILIFRKKVIQFLVIFILLKLAIHIGLMYTTSLHLFFFDQQRWAQIEMLYRLFPVEQMAVGGLGAAFLFYDKSRMLTFIYHKLTLLFALVGLAVIVMLDLHGIYVTYVEAAIFAVLIMQLTHSTFAKKSLENRLFSRLGDMSFGIYMWHTTVVALLIYGLPSAFYQITGNWGLHILSFILSVITAHFSYRYIESPILKLKKYFLPGAVQKQEVKQVGYVQG
jgi:peptidoglycan/LPS O-acetylase OafA/YrhL